MLVLMIRLLELLDGDNLAGGAVPRLEDLPIGTVRVIIIVRMHTPPRSGG